MIRLERAPRVTCIVLSAILLVLMCVRVALASFPLDLHVYLVGGSAVFHGQDLYGSTVQVKGFGFTYPPFAAMLFALPSQLADGVAIAGMTVLSLLALAAFLGLIVRHTALTLSRPWHGWAIALLVPALIACEPDRLTVWNGQINLILAAILAWDVLDQGHDRVRGVGIGITTGIKLTPGVFIVYLYVTRQWRSAVIATGTFAATGAVGFAVLPHDSAKFWLHMLMGSPGIGHTATSGNQSLHGLLERAIGSKGVVFALWLVLACATLALGLWVTAWADSRGERVLALSVLGILSCLLSPVAWTHHWLWCMPAAIALLGRVFTGRPGLRATLFCGLALFMIGSNRPPLSWTFTSPLGRAIVENGFVLAGLGLLAWLAVQARRSRTVADQAPAPWPGGSAAAGSW